jgi:hypothetical protein
MDGDGQVMMKTLSSVIAGCGGMLRSLLCECARSVLVQKAIVDVARGLAVVVGAKSEERECGCSKKTGRLLWVITAPVAESSRARITMANGLLRILHLHVAVQLLWGHYFAFLLRYYESARQK